MTAVTGYTAGVYDMFHVGHLRALQEARSCCSRLIVAVLGDAEAERRSGRHPFVPAGERMAVLASLDCIDEVVSAGGVSGADLADAWRELRYGVLFTGTDLDAPFDLALPPELAAVVRVVDLPRVAGTASALLRSVLVPARRASVA